MQFKPSVVVKVKRAVMAVHDEKLDVVSVRAFAKIAGVSTNTAYKFFRILVLQGTSMCVMCDDVMFFVRGAVLEGASHIIVRKGGNNGD